MKNITLLALVAISVGLTACVSDKVEYGRSVTESLQEKRAEHQAVRVDQMTLHRHSSGLCFAAVQYYRSLSITNIPCQNGDTTFVP